MIRALLLGMALSSVASAAVTVVVRPSSATVNSGDAYNSSATPSTNFGNAGALVVAGNGAVNTKGEFASVLKFDLATVVSTLNTTFGAGQWTLDSVQLELTAAAPLNSSFNANNAGSIGVFWLADDSWVESGLTWNGLPSLLAGGTQSMGSLSYGGGTGTVDYTLAASMGFLSDLQAGGVMSMELAAVDPNVSMTMNSRNFGTAASRPALIITASPEPSRVVLIMLGVAGAMARRRRR